MLKLSENETQQIAGALLHGWQARLTSVRSELARFRRVTLSNHLRYFRLQKEKQRLIDFTSLSFWTEVNERMREVRAASR